MHKRIFIYVAIFISCGLLFYSYKSEHPSLKNCEKKSNPDFISAHAATVFSKSEKIGLAKHINNYCNDIALFLAGRKMDKSSEIYKYTTDTSWINYQKNLTSKWNTFYHEKLEYIGQWSNEKLVNVNDRATIALYPFSGPDFLYMYKFLPDADEYYLFGLEHVGTIPDISKMKGAAMPYYLQSLNNSISTLIDVSYFITKRMMRELNNVKIDGVLPVILFFMAESDVKVTDIKPALIDSVGAISTIALNADEIVSSKFGKGVEITFLSLKNKQQKLYYFSGDLQNRNFSDKSKIHKMLYNLNGNIVTLIKSASYLLHGNNFCNMRNLVLKKSNFIIQDDTGIPYHSFPKGEWDLCFFGKYTVPIRCFSYCYQNDLAKSFPKDAEKLDFRFGYNKTSYILVASKINPEKLVLLPRGLPDER